jgi:hypothetical protein
MNRDQFASAGLRSRIRAAFWVALLAAGTVQASGAKDRPNLAGFYLTHSVALDDPRWRIEDLACRGSCSLGGFHYLQKLLSDPRNNERPVKDLLKDVGEFSKKESAGLMTKAARRQAEHYDPAADPVIEECRPEHDGWKHQLLAPLPMQIEQDDEKVLLRYEYWNAVRTVYIDGRGYQPKAAPSRLGQSIGRYEGKTLVVETTGIIPNLFGLPGMGSIKHSDQARAVERYTLSDDGNRLDLEWTFIDPVNFTKPVQGQKSFLSSPDGELEEFVCEAVTGQY